MKTKNNKIYNLTMAADMSAAHLAVGVVNADTIILVDFKRDKDVSSYDMSFLCKSTLYY
jgi:hypothetical protein